MNSSNIIQKLFDAVTSTLSSGTTGLILKIAVLVLGPIVGYLAYYFIKKAYHNWKVKQAQQQTDNNQNTAIDTGTSQNQTENTHLNETEDELARRRKELEKI